MIDLLKEDVRTLADAAKLLPPRRRGKRPHPSTLARWGKSGCKGVFLEVLKVGDTMCTSTQALQRFVDAVTATTQDPSLAPTNRSELLGNEERIEEQLDCLGL